MLVQFVPIFQNAALPLTDVIVYRMNIHNWAIKDSITIKFKRGLKLHKLTNILIAYAPVMLLMKP